jgi:phosphoglycolate phosphatase
MANRNLLTFSLEQVKEMIGGGVVRLLERALSAQGLPPDNARPIANEFLTIYATRAMIETTLYPGAIEQLVSLAEAGVRIGLCTNKPQAMTDLILRDMDLARYFGSVIGGRDDMPRKPDPASLQAVIAALSAAPGRTLMVGDSAADVGAARASGAPVAVVSHGYSKIPVHELGADAVIDSLWDLPRAMSAITFSAKGE